MHKNNLKNESSPYLLQHAENPVHWQPWGDPAFAHAREQNKPVLLSVGYSACHWCHVMARECFQDAEIAALMNAHFVNVKVDREERPDLDMIYQSALALLGGQGGWPLTLFLTAEGDPFWGGTYFPPRPSFGRPGFGDILQRIAEVYRKDRDRIQITASQVLDALGELAKTHGGDGFPPDIADRAAKTTVQELDRIYGGFGYAPKFPHPGTLAFLWRAWLRTGNETYRDAVILTLDRMCQGGIYDHLGGGFARYATDAAWLIPHFEKMLYDNAQMIEVLTMVWRGTGRPLYKTRVLETVDWLLREMSLDDGGFAGTMDADSEGEEGKFYIWHEPEIDELLGEDARFFKDVYDVTSVGNWENKTILNRSARSELLSEPEERRLAACRKILFDARSRRPHPRRDDKVLADWNGLVIAALSLAADTFDLPAARAAAKRAFIFVREHMSVGGDEPNRLQHSWCSGETRHPATLDDYANMCRAAIALYQGTGDTEYLDQSKSWIDLLDNRYLDGATGTYFFTADDVTDVITRTRSIGDHATPAGNATIASVFSDIFYLTGERVWRGKAETLISAFSDVFHPDALRIASLLIANEKLQRTVQVVIAGDPDCETFRAMRAAVNNSSAPDLVLHVVRPGAELPEWHPAYGKTDLHGDVAGYVCRDMTCSPPVTDPVALMAALNE